MSATPPVPVPDPNFGGLLIVNDTLYPIHQESYEGYDLHVRTALFVMTQLVPPVSAVLLVLSRKRWWLPKFYWTMSRLMILWLLSVQLFGAIVFFQRGATTRVLFLAGALHLQIEYLIIALLLKSSGLKALVYAYVGGTILYTVQMFVKDLSVAYIITTIAGFSDFLIPLLCLHGKQYLYAIGGFAHLVQAIAVFCVVVRNYGHVSFDFVTWVTTWIMNGALVAAVYQALTERAGTGITGAISLPVHGNGSAEPEAESSGGAAIDNPLAGIDIPPKTLALFFGIAVAGSVVSAFVFTFVVGH